MRNIFVSPRGAWLFTGLAVLLPLYGQTSGTIFGHVSDSSGGAIVGKDVQARHLETGLIRTAVTNDAGAYLLSSLPSGPYQISVTVPGFRTHTQSGITVQVGENARVDIVLEVGSTTETVSVEAEALAVDTQSSTVGATVDRRRLESLPLNGRNLLELAQLLPGVGAGSFSTTNPNARTGPVITVSGSRQAGNNMVLDGTSMVQAMYNRGVNYPNPDAIQEFRVLTNTYSAEYGRGWGGIFLGITKSGTNNIHGSLFEFFRNDKLNARNFFAASVPKLRQNQFGGSLGGPLWLPGYDGRNRTFLFGSYQGLRIRPESGLRTYFPPTTAELRGDFSALPQQILDPSTNLPFPGNMIPTARLDPAALAYLTEYLPAPNRPDGSHVEFRSMPTDGNQIVIKGDQIFRASDRVSLRWLRNRDRISNEGTDSLRLAGPRQTTISSGALNHTHIFSPGLLNEASLSIFRIDNRTEVSPFNKTARDFGLNVIQDGPLPMAPRIVVTGRFNSSPQTFFEEPETTWQFSDKVAWNRGRQAISTGIEFRNIAHVTRVQNWTGDWNFDGRFSRNALADLLLGRPFAYNQQSLLEDVSDSEQYHVFVQDDIKVNRKLTLNLGLRYELYMPFIQVHGKATTFRAGVQSVRFPKAPTGLLVPGDPGVKPGIISADTNNFLPRIGFAFDPTGDGRTAIRGAYGIFITPAPALDIAKGNTTLPWRLLVSVTNPASLQDPFAGTINPFPFQFQPDGDFPSVPIGANAVDPGNRDGYVQQYNLNVQRQFGSSWVAQAGYVGSSGRKLSATRPLNFAPYGPGATAANLQQRRLYPRFSGIGNTTSDTNSQYHSLQTSVNKRFSAGYTFQMAYTFSKSIDERSGSTTDDGTGVNNPFDYKTGERGLSDFHQSHILALNGVWDLPFVRDRGVLTAIVRDWQLSGKFRLTSGLPFSVISGRDVALSGTGSQRMDVVGEGHLDSGRSTEEKVAQYFNTSAFALPQTGTFGNSGRNLLIGPGFRQTDMAINRRFPLWGEQSRLEFRSEFFNLFNNTNFGNPVNSLASPAFGRLQTAQDARVIQLALRIDF